MDIYGIIGKPLGHSLSPSLHNWAFTQLAHAGFFKAWPIENEQLSVFVNAMRVLRICGACVTIPHKESIIPLLDSISARAQSIGAVNTLYWQGDMLCGENTDVDGFKLPLLTRPRANAALILGAGGAARAVVMGLKELEVEHIYISNRNGAKANAIAEDFNIKSISWEERHNLCVQWIINSTPLGMLGSYEHESAYDFTIKKDYDMHNCLAYDLVYNPLETKFLHQAKQCGIATQDGLDMFVGQALSQMQLWMGKHTQASITREHLLKILMQR